MPYTEQHPILKRLLKEVSDQLLQNEEFNRFTKKINEVLIDNENDYGRLERILEISSNELFRVNEELKNTNENLEENVKQKTKELQESLIQLNEKNNQLTEAIQKAEKSEIEKSNFFANMSHELRTPIHGIINLIDIIGLENTNEEIAKQLHLLEFSAQHLSKIVDDILDISKLNSNKYQINPLPVQLNRFIEDLVLFFDIQFKIKQIEFITDIRISPKLVINCDENRLKQVLFNIIGNALKFTEKGFVKFSIEQEITSSNESLFRFEIKDTGIGMSEFEISQLFKPYFQANGAQNKTKQQGTGLGLTISNRIIQLMESEIKVKSAPGVGSQFNFELHLSHSELNFNTIDDKNYTSLKMKEKKILVAEDNKINQFILKKYLDKPGYTVIYAEDGEQTLQHLQKEAFDFVFLDVHMPKLNGIEVLEKAITANYFGFTKPVVLPLTADIMPETISKLTDLGADEFVCKPFTADKINELLIKFG